MKKLLKLMMKEQSLHMVYSFMIVASLYTALQLFLPFSTSLGVASILTILLGVAKEFRDEKFDPIDLGWDVVGVVLYVLLVLIQIHF